MIFTNCPYVDHILHALVSIVILVSQLYLIFSYDHAHDLRESASAVGVTAVILLLIQHVVRAIQTSSGDEDTMTKMRSSAIRNFLTLVAFSAEFTALGVEVAKPSHQLEDLTLPVIIIVSLCAMRLLDSIMDQPNVSEAFGVQCVKDPWGLRVILIHLLIALSVGLQSLKMYEWNKDGVTNNLDKSVQDLDTSVLVLSCVHLLIYPLNKALRACQLDKMLIQCSCLRCFKGQTNENCDGERGSQDQDLELVAITRLPIVRQLIAGVILAGNAYVFGSAIGHNELTYQIPAALLYACADIAGRNYM